MRANAKKFSRVLIPLALAAFGLALVVLALGLLQLPVTPVRAAGTTFTVTVTTDAPTYCYCEDITVTAIITNTGPETAVNVTGTISWDPSVAISYVSGPTPSFPASMASGDHVTLVWVLHCEGPGPATITVAVEAENAPEATGTADITQYKAHLDVGLLADPADVCVGDPFTVKVPIENTGNITATNVSAILSVGAEATCDPLVPSSAVITDTETVTFTAACTCTAMGNTTISVASVSGTDGCTTDPIPSGNIDLPGPITVKQRKAHLVMSLDAPAEAAVGNGFNVTVSVENTGTGDADDVLPSISYGAGATCIAPGDEDIDSLITKVFTWACTCDDAVDVVFTVTGLTSGTDACTGDDIEAANYELPGPETVVQKLAPTVGPFETAGIPGATGTITDPITVGKSFTFQVTAVISNPHGTTIPDVYADLEIVVGEAEVVSPAPPKPSIQGLGDIGPDKEEFVSWMVHCTGEGLTIIRVTAVGISYDIYVDQVKMHPSLRAEILEPTGATAARTDADGNPKYYPSETFSVYAKIWNDGAEPALEVEAELSFVFEQDFVGDGITKEFDLPYAPIVADSETVYLDGEEQATGYSIDYAAGKLVFDEAPGVGAEIAVEYECDGASFEIDGHIIDQSEKELGDIDGGDYREVKWTVHCDEPGLVRITVIPSGKNDITRLDIENIHDDFVVVRQVPREEITIGELDVVELDGVVSSDHEKIGTCTYYSVTALITNTGYADLEDVEVTIAWDGHVTLEAGSATIDIGPLLQHKDEEVSWKFHCSQGADTTPVDPEYVVPFTVVVTGTSAICGEVVTDTDDLTIVQKDLVVDIIEPPDGYKDNENETFIVTAEVYNRYNETLNPIEATIVFSPADGATVIAGANPQPIGPMIPKEMKTVTWEVRCEKPGATTIKVTAEGKSTPSSDPIDNYDEIVVIQQEKAHLEAVILEPDDERWFGLSNIYPVVVTVTNKMIGVTDPDLKATAEDVEVDLIIDGEADIIAGPDPALPFDLEAGAGALVTWWLHCTGPCHVDITADPTGIDANLGTEIDEDNTDEPGIKVHQMPLEVEIYQYPTEPITKCRTFGISAKIKNVSEAGTCEKCVVPDVSVTIEVETGLASLLDQEQATKYVGDVITPPQEVEWTLHCDGPGIVKIRVTATTSKNPQTDPPEDLGYDVSTSALVAFWQVPSPVKYSIPLQKDWNLMSLPVMPERGYEGIEDVLATLCEGCVWEVWYCDDGCDDAEDWYLYWPGHDVAPDMELTEMEDGKGYFIRMYWPDTLLGQGNSYCDLPPDSGETPPEYALDEGWNLVGFTTCDFNGDGEITQADDWNSAGRYLMNLDDGVRGLGLGVVGDEARILRYWEPGISWEAVTDDTELMKVGYGYFLRASLDELSIVPPANQNPYP